MLLTIVAFVGVLGHLSNGVPLEDLLTDFKPFFESRIVGGSQAPEGSAPHMAALIVGHHSKAFVCGGSIITKRVILTAAHCITGFLQWDGELMNTFHATVGSNIWHKGTEVRFKGYRNHPEYDQWLIKNDAGVLFAEKEIQMSKRVATIGLSLKPVGGGEKTFVTGWGTDQLWGAIPTKLQILFMTTLSTKECKKLAEYIASAIWGGWSPPIDAILEICTLHDAGAGHGMCHGDSGSALALKKCGSQVGIVSWGFPCAIGGPDVFTSILGVKNFLQSVIGLDYKYENESLSPNDMQVV